MQTEVAASRGGRAPSLLPAAVLGFGAFAAGTDEFILAGVLPQLKEAFGISIAAAGQVVTVFALTSALSAPLLAVATAAQSRRRVLLAVSAVGAVVASVPEAPAPAPAPETLRDKLAPLADRGVLTILLTTTTACLGVYIVYTYISAVFSAHTGNRLAVLLFVIGVSGVVGNLITGALVYRRPPRAVVAGTLALLIATLFAIPFASGVFWSAIAVVVVYGLASWSLLGPQQLRLFAARPEAAPLLASLNTASIYVAISLSGAIGGVVGGRWLSLVAVVFVVLALALSELAHRLSAAAPPPSEAQPQPKFDAV